MFKGEVINGYTIQQDFIVAGGRSKISFATKDGKEYFIKEFLAPKYPMPDSPGSEKVKEQKKKVCEAFEKHHRELNRKVTTKVSSGGNLVYTVDFFRNGPCYYKITEKIDTESLSCKDIASLPVENILLISKCVCHSLRILHDLGVVHGDLKPDNILIKKTSSSIFAAKLIDFDDSYIDGLPPASKNIVGTPEYYSPELAAYIMDEDGEVDGRTLTVKSDIFTLGIILCEYFTGEKPIVEASYKNVWNSVSHGVAPTFPCHLRSDVSALLRKMLHKDPTRRPTIHEVFDTLKKMKKHAPVPKSPETVPATGGLRGKGIAIAKK